jgi:hypothetical protein
VKIEVENVSNEILAWFDFRSHAGARRACWFNAYRPRRGRIVLLTSGGGDRTRDTRLMKPPLACHNYDVDKTCVDGGSLRAHGRAQECPKISPPNFASRPSKPSKLDPDLSEIIGAWPNLPDAIKSGILAMVQATVGMPGGNQS